jgi:hypothetical protein
MDEDNPLAFRPPAQAFQQTRCRASALNDCSCCTGITGLAIADGSLPPSRAPLPDARQGLLRGKGRRKAGSSALHQVADIGVS